MTAAVLQTPKPKHALRPARVFSDSKQAARLLDYVDRFITYFERAKGHKPRVIHLRQEQLQVLGVNPGTLRNGVPLQIVGEPEPVEHESPTESAPASDVAQVAADYWAERPQLLGRGVVVVFKGQVAGWMSTLRDPQQWEPGCIAIHSSGYQYLAVGGNAYQGATEWKVIWSAGPDEVLS